MLAASGPVQFEPSDAYIPTVDELFRILCRWQKQADFLSVFAFLKAHSRCYVTEKGEKWRKMSRF
jgi:hypothetical protein